MDQEAAARLDQASDEAGVRLGQDKGMAQARLRSRLEVTGDWCTVRQQEDSWPSDTVA